MANVLGYECVLKYKTGGIGGGGSWTELTNVRDATFTMEAAEADLTTRNNNGWRATVSTLKDATVEFEMVWDTADAGFTAIKNAFLGATAADRLIGFQVLDSAGNGLQADFNITQFTRNENLEEGVTVSVSAKVAYSSNAPSWLP